MMDDMLTTACATEFADYTLDAPVSQEDLNSVQPESSENIVAWVSKNGHVEYLLSGTREIITTTVTNAEILVSPPLYCGAMGFATI